MVSWFVFPEKTWGSVRPVGEERGFPRLSLFDFRNQEVEARLVKNGECRKSLFF